jgi:hypothetical protein
MRKRVHRDPRRPEHKVTRDGVLLRLARRVLARVDDVLGGDGAYSIFQSIINKIINY